METGPSAETNFEFVRTAIQSEFIARSKVNPAYSLRAFANYLEIDQSFLSKVLKGQRRVTKEFAESIGPKVGLKLAQIQRVTRVGKSSAAQPVPLKSLSEDEFEVLSDWRHFAIIELSKTVGFKLDIGEISRRLKIHVTEVKGAIDRLERLGFIDIDEDRLTVLSPNTTWSNSKKTSTARKLFQKSLIEKSLVAVEHVPFERRDNGSVTVAIDSSRLPEFKEKLIQIRRELADYFQPNSETKLDEVYQLTIALFPLTRPLSNASKSQGEK